MSHYKKLKGFACSIAHKFSCSAEYFCFMSYRDKQPVVNIDLLSLKIEPDSFNIERNRILVGYCRDNLLKLTERHGLIIKNATLTCYFTENPTTILNPARFEVCIIDEMDKEWCGVYEEPEQLVLS